MGREIRRVPPDYQGFDDKRNRWKWSGEKCISPEGTGFQMWETTSAGSPISPVFATEDEMVAWLVKGQRVGLGGSEWQPSEETARAFVRDGYAVTMALIPGRGLVDGLDMHDPKARR